MIGTILGRYRILEHIASGGMAEVYKAVHSESHQLFAIKVLPPEYARDGRMQERFNREIANVRRLEHPNIIKIHEDGQSDELCYFIMDYVEGESLSDLIERKGALSVRRALKIFAQICKALKYSHRRGIVHRDMKPANILITREGKVVVTDFGIAKMQEENRLTTTGVGIGTPEYISPEQARGRSLDQRSDIYSLGVVLYQMLTGKVPFSADTPIAVVMQHIRATPPPPSSHNPQIPDWLEAIMLKMLAKEPAERYRNVSSLMRAISREIRRAPQAKAMPQQKKAEPRKIRKKNFTALVTSLIMMSIVYLGIAAAILVWFNEAKIKKILEYTKKAEELVEQERFDEALTYADKLSQFRPEESKSLRDQIVKDIKKKQESGRLESAARRLFEEGKFEEAQTQLSELAAIDPSNKLIADLKSKIDEIRRKQNKQRAEIFFHEAQGLFEACLYSEALRKTEACLRLEPGHDGALNLKTKAERMVAAGLDKMALVPAGSFIMGSNENENDPAYPAHEVNLRAFYIDVHEVTNSQYKEFIDSTQHPQPRLWKKYGYPFGKDDFPVCGVSYEEAANYAKWAGKRLPTEAEWEYACRAGTNSKYTYGNSITHNDANYGGKEGEDSWEKVSPVGSFGPNDWGLYDMHGNVWEWCSDWFAAYPDRPTELRFARKKLFKVLRGGAWESEPQKLSSGYRKFDSPKNTQECYGFRCVKDAHQ